MVVLQVFRASAPRSLLETRPDSRLAARYRVHQPFAEPDPVRSPEYPLCPPAATSESLQLPVCASCSPATVLGCFADAFPPGDIRRARHRPASPGSVRGVPRRAPQSPKSLPGRADRGASAPLTGALPDHAAGPGKACGLRRESLVNEAISCRSRAEIGIPATPGESFILHDDDTIATVQQTHRQACESSRRAASPLGLDDVVHGNRRGPLPLRWVYLHMLRELAQHCGHADILREQLISE